MAQNSFAFADDLGPEKVVEVYDTRSGLKAVVVIDNTARGPAIGGVRMAPDVSTAEAFRLARAMTLKNAMAGLRHGGGKSVIFGSPTMPLEQKEELIRAFARRIATLTDYTPGPDMGTNETCMAWIHDEIGRAVGLPAATGGIPLDEIGATGWGLTAAIAQAAAHIKLDLRGATFAVQGFGAVGEHVSRFLVERGAVLVGASDHQATIVRSDGLNLNALIAGKRRGEPLSCVDGAHILERDHIISVACDIWIPAARPDVIRASNVDRLNTKIVAQGANIPATSEAEARLYERGIIVLPDFVANAGGVICGAIELHGGTRTQAMAIIHETITANTQTMLAQSTARNIPPRAAAMEIAKGRVMEAMEYRR